MDPLQRLKEAAQAFRHLAQAESSWFEKNQPECREGERLLKTGQAAEAERLFRKASEEAKGGWGQKRQRPRMLLALATAEWRQGKLEEARRSGEEALALLGGERGKGAWEYGAVCELLGRAAWDAGDCQTAIKRMREAVAGGKAQREMEGSRLVERQRAVGSMLQASGREAEAGEAWKEALETAEGRCGAESAAAADCLMDLCGAAARRGSLEEAKGLGERAVQARRAACGNDSMDVAKDLEALAGYCQAEREFEAAVRYLEQALQVRDRQIGGNTPELAMLLMALADVYSLLGRIAPALELMRQAVGKLGPGKDRNLAVALEKLGSMHQRTGRYEDAAECYTRARQYWGEHAEESGDELLANSAALQQLAEVMPALAEKAESAEGDDPGISVLLPEGPARRPRNVAEKKDPRRAGHPEVHAVGAARAAHQARTGAAEVPGGAEETNGGAVAEAAPVTSREGAGVAEAPPGWVRAPQGGGEVGTADAHAADEAGWNGWEDVEFELLLTGGEGRER